MTDWSAYYGRAFKGTRSVVDRDAEDARMWRSLAASPSIEAGKPGRGGNRLSIRFGRHPAGGCGRTEALATLVGILGPPVRPAVHPEPAVRADANALRALRDGTNRILLSHGSDALSVELWPARSRTPKTLLAPRDATDRWSGTGIAITDYAKGGLGSVEVVRDRWTVEAWRAAVAGSRTTEGLHAYAGTEVGQRDASAIREAAVVARASEAAAVILGDAMRWLEEDAATHQDVARLARVRDGVRLWRPCDGAEAAVAAFREMAEVCAAARTAGNGRWRDCLEQGAAVGKAITHGLFAA